MIPSTKDENRAFTGLRRRARRLVARLQDGRLLVPAWLWCRGWLLFHFFATAMLLLPVNAVTANAYPLVSSYLLPAFQQSWSLFAPDPDGKTRHFLFQCSLETADGGKHISALFDGSRPFYESTWRMRLGPGQRVQRAFSSISALLGVGDSRILHVHRYFAQGNPAVMAWLEQRIEERRAMRITRGKMMAHRLAFYACHERFPNETILDAYAALDIVSPLPFLERLEQKPKPQPVRITYGWSHQTVASVRATNEN